MSVLLALFGKLLEALFGAGAAAIDAARDDRAHQELGASEQARCDAAAASAAKAKADSEALRPPDVTKTISDLDKGEF